MVDKSILEFYYLLRNSWSRYRTNLLVCPFPYWVSILVGLPFWLCGFLTCYFTREHEIIKIKPGLGKPDQLYSGICGVKYCSRCCIWYR